MKEVSGGCFKLINKWCYPILVQRYIWQKKLPYNFFLFKLKPNFDRQF